MSTTSAAQYAAARLKAIAQQQVKAIEQRPKPIRPSEQLRRFQSGEESWRVEQGLITPEQYARYIQAMQQLEV